MRNRLSNKLISDLSDIWHANGPDILRKMAIRDPVQLARLAYATLPKDILVSVEQRIPGGLDADDWAVLLRVLDTIKGAIPPDSDIPPAEIFGVIETALRSHFARAIEAPAWFCLRKGREVYPTDPACIITGLPRRGSEHVEAYLATARTKQPDETTRCWRR